MRIALNMAMSLDGKIATKARGPVKLGSSFDTKRMAEIRALHDAVINGASTFRAYPYPLRVEGESLLRARARRGQSVQPMSAIVSSRLDIPRNTPWEKAIEAERWVFCGKSAPSAKISSLERAGIQVVCSRSLRPSPKEILRAFGKVGAERILLEGGGEFNASFLELGLVDTLYLTVTPLLIGGADAPTWFEGKGFSKGKFPRFRLADCEQVKDELYLTYTQS